MGTEMGYRGPKWTLECKHQGVSQVTSWRLISSLCTKTQAVNKLLEEKAPESLFKCIQPDATQTLSWAAGASGNLTVRDGSAVSNLQSLTGFEQELCCIYHPMSASPVLSATQLFELCQRQYNTTILTYQSKTLCDVWHLQNFWKWRNCWGVLTVSSEEVVFRWESDCYCDPIMPWGVLQI